MAVEATTSIVVDFGRRAALDPVELVLNNEDEDENGDVMYQPENILFTLLNNPGQFQQGFEILLRYGWALVRLYAPRDLPVAVRALSVLTEKEPPLPFFFTVGLSTLVKVNPSGFAGKQVVSLGRRSELHRELLVFDGSTSQSLRHPYDAPNAIVLDASEFIDETGTVQPRPSFRLDGSFVADRNVWGAMLVQYDQEYTLYKVFYDLPEPLQLYEAWANDDDVVTVFQVKEPPTSPPLILTARSKRGMSLLQVPRKIHDWEYSSRSDKDEDNEIVNFDGVETARTTSLVPVVNPANPAQQVDVARFTSVTLRDDNTGQTMKLRFSGG